MTAPDRLRDGGPFTAGAVCPWCGTAGVHAERNPNPWPPGTAQFDTWRPRRHRGRPRWDERLYRRIRTCTGCGYEWGQR